MSEKKEKLELSEEELNGVSGGMGAQEFVNIANSFESIGDAAQRQVEAYVNGQWVVCTIVSARFRILDRGKSIEAFYSVKLQDGNTVYFDDMYGIFNLRFIGQ